MNSEIDRTHTRLFRHALNINWWRHVTNVDLYGDLPKISSVIQQRRLRLAGHCHRIDESVANVMQWKPEHGYRRPGRPRIDCVTLLTQDTGLTNEEIRTEMSDRELWRNYVDSGAPDWWWCWPQDFYVGKTSFCFVKTIIWRTSEVERTSRILSSISLS